MVSSTVGFRMDPKKNMRQVEGARRLEHHTHNWTDYILTRQAHRPTVECARCYSRPTASAPRLGRLRPQHHAPGKSKPDSMATLRQKNNHLNPKNTESSTGSFYVHWNVIVAHARAHADWDIIHRINPICAKRFP